MHVDHVNYFDLILFRFCVENTIDPSHVALETVDIGRKQLVDRELASAWWTYHKTNAQLRVITAKENLTRKRPPKCDWLSLCSLYPE